MRYREIITEAWHNTFRLHGGDDVDVYKNPSKAELTKLFQQARVSNGLALRALLTTDGSIYVWDAFIATHNDLEYQMYDYPLAGGYIYLHRDYVFFNDMHYFANDEGQYDESYAYRPVVRGFYNHTVNNRSLQQFYGNPPKIIAVDYQPCHPDVPKDQNFEITPEFIERYVAPRAD